MRDEIIKMAEICGIPEFENNESQADNIIRFFHMAQAAEREACAKVCESMINNDADWDSHHWNQAVQRCEYAIRARGQA